MPIKLNDQSKPVRLSFYERRIIYICPKCGKPLVFHKLYQGRSLCILCGQRLDWSLADQFQAETIYADNATEAAFIAEKYYNACDMNEKDWINLDEFRRSLSRDQSIELYLFFKSPKEYGRFKRSMK